MKFLLLLILSYLPFAASISPSSRSSKALQLQSSSISPSLRSSKAVQLQSSSISPSSRSSKALQSSSLRGRIDNSLKRASNTIQNLQRQLKQARENNNNIERNHGWKSVDFFVGEHLTKLEDTYHAQCGQDWLVPSLLNCPQNGYFVDLAANDAVTLSNTLVLEQRLHWNGICIEPNLLYYQSRRSRKSRSKPGDAYTDVLSSDPDGISLLRRKCQVVRAAVSTPRNTKVLFDFGGKSKWGALGGVINPGFDNSMPLPDDIVEPMRTTSFLEVLFKENAPRHIDYLSLDVEGAESVVMEGFDWKMYRFQIITVERPKPDLVDDLIFNGYKKLRSNAAFDDETWYDSTSIKFDDRLWMHEKWEDLPKESCMGRKPKREINSGCT